MQLRDYQTRAVDRLFDWWAKYPGVHAAPIVVMPTGAGKSVVIAEIVRRLFAQWPDHHPRTLVITPSKELAEQNAAKLAALLPDEVTVGLYSASLNRRDAHADVIVATIGSVYKRANDLGNIKCVLIDECHLVDTAGKGRYRQLIDELARLCTFRVAGFTATPFRGNGIWLTAGDDPLFTGIADTITVEELLKQGHLAPLRPPAEAIATHVDVSGVATTSGDYNIAQLDERVRTVLRPAAQEAIRLAAERRKWIAFLPTVESADIFRDMLREQGIAVETVTGETPKAEREAIINAFRAGQVRCLVTVLALATGFDVPDVDCVIWMRPTISPVLYVQGAGRGMRPAPGKTDCLWLDFTDTTERLGPVDSIRGRAPKSNRKRTAKTETGEKYCEFCGEPMPAIARFCTACGKMQPQNIKVAGSASTAPVLANQRKPERRPVFEVRYRLWPGRDGKPPTLRIDYYGALRIIASEWKCFEHTGTARRYAEQWWRQVSDAPVPDTIEQALAIIESQGVREPSAIDVVPNPSNPSYLQVAGRHFEEQPETQDVPF